MPLYLCALKNIRRLAPDSTVQTSENCHQEDFTYLKKEKRLAYVSVPELDCAYSFSDRKVFRLADSITDYFFWQDKLHWSLGYDAAFNNENRSFTLLGTLIDTLFSYDCESLSTEFREWDALVEHESRTDPALYTVFRTLHSALDFAKESGALWYFECAEQHIDQYFQVKKKYSTQSI